MHKCHFFSKTVTWQDTVIISPSWVLVIPPVSVKVEGLLEELFTLWQDRVWNCCFARCQYLEGPQCLATHVGSPISGPNN